MVRWHPTISLITLIASNKEHLDTLTEIWSSPPLLPPPSFHFQLFIRTESVHGECSGNHVLITHWPFDPWTALIPPDTIAHRPACASLCRRGMMWNPNCRLCEYNVFAYRASPLSHSKLQGMSTPPAQARAQRYTLNPSRHQSTSKVSGLQIKPLQTKKMEVEQCFLMVSSHIKASKLPTGSNGQTINASFLIAFRR